MATTTTGTVAQIAHERWGVNLRIAPNSRFAKDGWSYEEAVGNSCPTCDGTLHSLRKPYTTSSGKPQRYVVLVCPGCSSSFTLPDLGLKSYADLSHNSAPKKGRLTLRAPESSLSPRVTVEQNGEAFRRANVVRFWRAVELFTAQKVEAPCARERRYEVPRNAPAPWEPGHPLQRAPITERDHKSNLKVWRYTVYGGIYSLDRLYHFLGTEFEEKPFDVDERTPRGDSALFSVEVSPDGRLLLDTLVLSTAGWAAGRTTKPGKDDPSWLDGFDHWETVYRRTVEERTKADEDDHAAEQLREQGIVVSRQVRASVLHSIAYDTAQRFNVANTLAPEGIRVECRLVPKDREYETGSDSNFLNSFLADDLDRVTSALPNDGCGEALAEYLSKDECANRLDVRAPENLEKVIEMLAPDRIPAGRWPNRPQESLATSQQLAVNHLMGDFSSSTGLFSVNGPPGTGKTTMLRDIVAALVTERACLLAEFRSPTAAFETEQVGWKTDRHWAWFYPLKQRLTGFEMVVASSNNAAVENITREVPSRDSVKEPWAEADYLREHSTRVLEKEAWGLVAAALGNKRNRSRFVDRLWWDPPHSADGSAVEPGLRAWLKQQQESTRLSTWAETVERFRVARDEGQAFRTRRQKAHTALRRLPALQEARQVSARVTQSAKAKLNVATANYNTACVHAHDAKDDAARAHTRRREHQDARPHILEIIFTLGGAIRRWHAEDAPLAAHQLEAENVEKAAIAQQRQARDLLQQATRDLHEAQERLERAESNLAAICHLIDEIRTSTDAMIPDQKWRESASDRERSAPWLDAAWNTARTEVFLAALEIHKAFLVGAGKKMLSLLDAAMNVVKGACPADVPARVVQAAWQGLFLVVPVVSTTFASVGRMFGPLERESLGWLLVDEAGQATPQAVVGAAWRSQRVVAVGDPLQLEPVVTILHSTQSRLLKHHQVDDTWMPDSRSVQILADRVTPLGAAVPSAQGDIWVGAPLRVHRRCLEPMFSIVNDTVYDGQMIHGTPAWKDLDGFADHHPPVCPSAWIDVRSDEAEGKWVPAEGDALSQLLAELLAQRIEPSDILVLSPFRAVSDRFKGVISQLDKRFRNEICGIRDGIQHGTVHRAQGKEAPVVVFVLGTPPDNNGARQWASDRPNLFNVAVSRARHRIFVIGNLESWRNHQYFSTLAQRLPVMMPEA